MASLLSRYVREFSRWPVSIESSRKIFSQKRKLFHLTTYISEISMYLQSSSEISDLENNNNNIRNKMEVNTKASNERKDSTDSRAKLCLICKRYTDHATMRCTKYKCHFCGQLGHIPKECPTNQQSNANESTDQDDTQQSSRSADPRKFPKRIEEIGKKGSYTFICYTVAAFDSVSKFATSGNNPKADSAKTAE